MLQVKCYINNREVLIVFKDEKPKFEPNQSTLQWLTEVYPTLENPPLECVLGPNEVSGTLLW